MNAIEIAKEFIELYEKANRGEIYLEGMILAAAAWKDTLTIR